jgi:photosystem II stability/assembly factor-like uncharacterized protein
LTRPVPAAGHARLHATAPARQTWLPRTDGQPSLAIGAIAFDPSNPAVVYAGTGEGDTTFADTPNLRGAGLLRSQDGGATWAVLATTPFVGQGFYDLLVDPQDGNHLLAATTVGLYESTDGGAHWTVRRTRRTWSLSMDPQVATNPSAGREVLAACADGLFRSTNAGTTWSAVTLPGLPANFSPKRMEARHAPSNGSIAFVFAAGPPQVLDQVNSTPQRPVRMPKPYLWRRSTAGGAFTAINTPPDVQTGQAWYDWYAAVAPNNPDMIYLGAINIHRGVRQPSGTWQWVNISAKTAGDSVHPDQHAIAFSPADGNTVYVGNDGGISRSADAGTHWRSLNKGLCICEIEFLAQHPQHESWLLAGTQDNGTMRYEGQQVWYHVQDGDGGDCGINNGEPYACFHSFFGMALERSTAGGGWGTWADDPVLSVPPAEDYPNGAEFYPPLDVNGPIMARAGKTVYLSTDSGSNWDEQPLPSAAGHATALAVPSATRVYVGTETGRMFRIDRTGGAWQTPVELGQPAQGYVSDLLVDPANPGRLFATFTASDGGRVYRSDNGGGQWANVSTGLPDGAAVNAIEIDPSHPDTLWVGVDVGVYRTTNAGGTWAPFSTGMPNVLVKDLVLHQPSRLLRAGTQARGVWEIAVDAPMMPDVELYLRDSVVDTGRRTPSPSGVANPFEKGSQVFWWQSPDIKADSPPFFAPSLDALDFEAFADDRSLVDGQIEFAAGLRAERAQRGQTVRVYVSVHNRGVNPATQVAVKVFFTAAAATWPDLPAGFWTNFPDNTLTAASPWQAIAPHRVIPSVDPGRDGIVGFEWPVPSGVGTAVSLLALVSGDNDTIATTERRIAELVPGNSKCALRNVAVVNPSPLVGPVARAMLLNVWPAGAGERQSLGVDRNGGRLLRAVLLSKRLAKLAKRARAAAVRLTTPEAEAVAQLLHERPDLKGKLDTRTAYRVPAKEGSWLTFPPSPDEPEPVVLLVNLKRGGGAGSVVVRDDQDRLAGGITLQLNPVA